MSVTCCIDLRLFKHFLVVKATRMASTFNLVVKQHSMVREVFFHEHVTYLGKSCLNTVYRLQTSFPWWVFRQKSRILKNRCFHSDVIKCKVKKARFDEFVFTLVEDKQKGNLCTSFHSRSRFLMSKIQQFELPSFHSDPRGVNVCPYYNTNINHKGLQKRICRRT